MLLIMVLCLFFCASAEAVSFANNTNTSYACHDYSTCMEFHKANKKLQSALEERCIIGGKANLGLGLPLSFTHVHKAGGEGLL